jgi:hypothetical protein
MVRAQNFIEQKISSRNEDYIKKAELVKEQKPVLVFEEITHDREPIKYYGYKEKFMSANEQSKIPNYALMIYDVSDGLPDGVCRNAGKGLDLYRSSSMSSSRNVSEV